MESRYLICLLFLAQQQTLDSGLLFMVIQSYLVIYFVGCSDILLWGGICNLDWNLLPVDQPATSVSYLRHLLGVPFDPLVSAFFILSEQTTLNLCVYVSTCASQYVHLFLCHFHHDLVIVKAWGGGRYPVLLRR